MNNLNGKTDIVAGGASGIGETTALLFAENGYNVVISDVNEKKGNQLAQQIKQSGVKAIFIKADVSKPEDCENLINEAVEAFGSVDVAFNNAGIGGVS